MSSEYAFLNGTPRPVCLLALTLTHCSREPEPSITAKDGSEMLLIKAGTFSMGGMEEDFEIFPARNT